MAPQVPLSNSTIETIGTDVAIYVPPRRKKGTRPGPAYLLPSRAPNDTPTGRERDELHRYNSDPTGFRAEDVGDTTVLPSLADIPIIGSRPRPGAGDTSASMSTTQAVSTGGPKTVKLPGGKTIHIADSAITDHLKLLGQQIKAAGGSSFGNIGQCRAAGTRPPGGAANSDHYWCGALDVGCNANGRGAGAGDKLAAWVKANASRNGGKPFRYALWRVANHFDHVHISAWEGWIGPFPTPPRFL